MTPKRRIPMHRPLLLISLLAFTSLAVGSLACAGSPAPEAETESPADGKTSGSAAAPTDGETTEEVAYEPAYPEDVSREGLTREDTAQQDTAHSHDPDSHTHDEGQEDHEHDGDPEHEEGHDDHQH